ncbi:hypothetical protein FOG51_01956 [Hanseniaspora uvarum]|jgi:voltage-dependent anion channel protein 2|uniref:Mitochondrial outer membrane protein porin 1 n=1 Tax=Hanseniaspora uvarum TaxID=29833 RepID=A0A1E5RPB1_HANUV|nr:hypothetical protein FOG48_03518 [Hanseniaspora uvarum]KAF0273080.1 hypothetical protein FOG51_01956 [Hanseniaspora uvarum]KAF0277647.1 hypothetical protein FOG50_01528 [Hanseniaspora uvarum]OEJ88716.1 Mitochondrial outer membrane protein porin 1 [Hanseniaspora uvarum]GMM42360.1 porin [Hanseniaspora uvarum]
MSAVSYSDISKNVNGLFGRDFFHASPYAVDVKTVAPNGVEFTAKAKAAKTAGLDTSIDSKFTDKATGLTVTQSVSNAANLNTKVELAGLAPGLKLDLSSAFTPSTLPQGVKLNLNFVQPAFIAKGLFDVSKNTNFAGDIAFTKNAYTLGTQVSYDISNGELKKYGLGLGYTVSGFSLAGSLEGNSLVASIYQKASPVFDIGAKATYDVSTKAVSTAFASKYDIDATSAVKGKINDAGLLELAYKQQLKQNVTLGVGASLNALKLDEPVHKFGWSLSFSV